MVKAMMMAEYLARLADGGTAGRLGSSSSGIWEEVPEELDEKEDAETGDEAEAPAASDSWQLGQTSWSLSTISPQCLHRMRLPAMSIPQLGQVLAWSLTWWPHSGHLIIAIMEYS